MRGGLCLATAAKHSPPGTCTCHWCSHLPWADGCCGRRSPVCYNGWSSGKEPWGSFGSNSKAVGWTASERSCSGARGQAGWHRSWWTPGFELQHCRQSVPEKCPPARGGKGCFGQVHSLFVRGHHSQSSDYLTLSSSLTMTGCMSSVTIIHTSPLPPPLDLLPAGFQPQ